MATPQSFDFYFDPSCPWTWATSRWLVDAAGQTGAEIHWRSLSLGVVNADRDIPEQYRSAMEAGAKAHRVIAALRAAERNDLVGDFYTEWGRRTHHDGVETSADLAGEVATAIGAEQWALAADDASWDAEVEGADKEGQDLAGGLDVIPPLLA
ncbi:MAG: DsbA family protein, partial [Ilumatobacteraceae bacterium]